MVAVAPPAASTWVLTHPQAPPCRDDRSRIWSAAGRMSRAMAQFLEACLLGSAPTCSSSARGPAWSPRSWVRWRRRPRRASASRCCRTPTRLASRRPRSCSCHWPITALGAPRPFTPPRGSGTDRLVVASLAGAVAAATIDAIAERLRGRARGDVGARRCATGSRGSPSQVALASAGRPSRSRAKPWASRSTWPSRCRALATVACV